MINDAIEDYELMILSQLKMCSDILASGGGEMLSVRANYGTGIIPTMFGAPFFIMPYENDTLPCTRNLEREEDTISKLRGTRNSGPPQVDLVKRCLDLPCI